MAVYRQWINAAQTTQIITPYTVAGVLVGTTVAPNVVWLYNDKGGLQPDTTTMSGYRLIAEASWDGGVNWVRSGPDILNQAWVQVAITGIDNTGNPAMPAQATGGYVLLGAGRSLLLNDIPKNCGRRIEYQVVVPLGGSNAGLRWRLIAEPNANTLGASDLSNGTVGTGALVLSQNPVLPAGLTTYGRAVADGIPVPIAFNAAMFTTGAGGTWTVQLGDIGAFYYTWLSGRIMRLSFALDSTSVAGTPGNALKMLIPDGRTVAQFAYEQYVYSDNGVAGVGTVRCVPGATVVELYKAGFFFSLSAWSGASTNNTAAWGKIDIPTM